MIWFNPKDVDTMLPAQGLKVLCFNKGDCYVAQRFNLRGKNYWIPLSFATHDFSTDAPHFFSYITFPEGYYGFMRVKSPITGELIHIDKYAVHFPKECEDLIEFLIQSFKSRNPTHE